MRLNVVVTGASSGIGRACVDALIGAGHRVFAGVRSPEDFAELSGPRLVPVQLDVTDSAGVRAAVDEVEAKLDGAALHGLVNNAGIAVGGPVECIPVEELERQLAVNVTGVVRVTQAFLPALRRGPGRIVNVSSMSGRITAPLTGPYSASKYALEALSDAARRELRPWGVRVSVVQPGAVSTRIWSKTFDFAADLEARLSPDQRELYAPAIRATLAHLERQQARAIPAARVAQAVVHALTARRPRTRYAVGLDARVAGAMARWLPDRVLDALFGYSLR